MTISRDEETGEFTINGTATSGRLYYLTSRGANYIPNNYVGMRLSISGSNVSKFYVAVRYYNSKSTAASEYEKNVNITNTNDYLIENYPYFIVALATTTNAVYTNDTLSVMLRSVNIKDNTYQPIAKTNKELTKANENAVKKFSDTSYQTVDQLAYNPTTKKLGLKVNGADTVIPFSGGDAQITNSYLSRISSFSPPYDYYWNPFTGNRNTSITDATKYIVTSDYNYLIIDQLWETIYTPISYGAEFSLRINGSWQTWNYNTYGTQKHVFELNEGDELVARTYCNRSSSGYTQNVCFNFLKIETI